jgi:hypothetical protein
LNHHVDLRRGGGHYIYRRTELPFSGEVYYSLILPGRKKQGKRRKENHFSVAGSQRVGEMYSYSGGLGSGGGVTGNYVYNQLTFGFARFTAPYKAPLLKFGYGFQYCRNFIIKGSGTEWDWIAGQSTSEKVSAKTYVNQNSASFFLSISYRAKTLNKRYIDIGWKQYVFGNYLTSSIHLAYLLW